MAINTPAPSKSVSASTNRMRLGSTRWRTIRLPRLENTCWDPALRCMRRRGGAWVGTVGIARPGVPVRLGRSSTRSAVSFRLWSWDCWVRGSDRADRVGR